MVKIPGNDAVELALPILAALYGGSSEVGRRISVQPLFTEHGKEGGEETRGETCEENGLDSDYRARGACPLWEGGGVVSEGSVVDLMNEDAEESYSHVVRVLLEVGVDLDDECGGDGGEQTGLSLSLAANAGTPCETHENQSCIQILVMLLYELLVVPLSLLVVMREELSPVILLGGWYILFPVAWT